MNERSILPHNWELPTAIRERLGESFGRQRSMFAEGHLLLVLHAPPGPDDTKRRGRFLWRNPSGQWNSSDLGGGPGVLGKHLAEYASIIEKLDALEEKASGATEYFGVLESIAPVQRAITNGYQTLEDARKSVPEDRLLLNYRDQAYDLQRTAELLYTAAKNALDFSIALKAEEESRASKRMADASHRLNVLVAFFFPLATLSALFGVNLRHGFEEIEPPLPVIGLVIIGLICGILLAKFIVRPGDLGSEKS